MKLSAKWLYPTAFGCLLLSGVAGLVYQVAWARYLSLLLGHTSYGVVAVLVAFMGGLAIGNAWLGRYADRLRRPLALYGWLEVGIAVYGLFFPRYFEACQAGYTAMAQGMPPGSPWLLALKFLFSFAAILVPATLMGGTLPVMVRLLTRSLGELRARVAELYFVNSAGAVLGVVVADFWWVPAYGLEATVLGAAALNALVGVWALWVNSGLRRESSEPGRAPEGAALAEAGTGTATTAGAANSNDGAGESFSGFELNLAVAAAGVSGFVAMLYEVVWTRLLALALGSSTHAFSIMLLTFISGIATGAWLVGRWRSLRRSFDAFGWIELALAASLLVSMWFYHLMPYAFYRLSYVVDRTPANHVIYQALQWSVCFAVMFVPTLLLGMTLPLASRVCTAELARTGRSVGGVFSVNTLGTVLGAALSGLVLLPWLGLAGTLILGVALNLAIAVLVLLRRRPGLRILTLAGAPVLVIALVALAKGTLDPLWDRAFSMGLWRLGGEPKPLRRYLSDLASVDLRYHRDGAGSTVALVAAKERPDGPDVLGLKVNGKTDATSHGDLPTQLLSGHIPMLLHTNATEVLVVGIGSGITGGAVLTYPEVQALDMVEISPEVRDVARDYFGPYNRRSLEHPKTRIILDDAKAYLRMADRRYDVIITEPSNPWMAGVSGVFSLEYYEACRERLKPGGITAQWVQVYETDDQAIQTVLATFGSVFPHFSAWQTMQGDLLLVGSPEPATRDLESLRRRFAIPEVTADLKRLDLLTVPALLSLQLVSESNGPHLVGPGVERHSDFYPVLEYIAERAFFVRRRTAFLEQFDERILPRAGTLLGEYLRLHPLTVQDARSVVLLHTTATVPDPQIVRSVLRRWQELAPEDVLPLEISSKMDLALPISELQALELGRSRDRILERAATDPEPLRMYSRHLMNAYRALRSVFHTPPADELRTVLERLVETDAEHRGVHQLRLAELAWDAGDDRLFLELATRALVPSAPGQTRARFDFDYSAPARVMALLIDGLWQRGRLDQARGWCQAAREAGYLDADSRFRSARLDKVIRKVEASTAGPVASADPVRETLGGGVSGR